MSPIRAPRFFGSRQQQPKIQLTNWSRHFLIAWKYGTPKKFFNLAGAYLHYLRGSPRLLTLPAFLKVEISRSCRVHCRYCLEPKAEIFYPFSKYRTLIDRLKDYLFEVSLHDVGEPLRNLRAIDFVKYAHLHRVGTSFSTSLSVPKPDEFWKDLVLSGLDLLVVSIDGISEEIYKRFRTYGDLNLVLANLRKILSYRSQYHSPMSVEWQMIDLPWNRQEQRAAKDLAQELGCDSFRLIAEVTAPRARYRVERLPRRRNCVLPFVIFIVNVCNQVRSCYKIYENNPLLGDLEVSTLEEIWNGEKIARIRDRSRIRDREPCNFCQE